MNYTFSQDELKELLTEVGKSAAKEMYDILQGDRGLELSKHVVVRDIARQYNKHPHTWLKLVNKLHIPKVKQKPATIEARYIDTLLRA